MPLLSRARLAGIRGNRYRMMNVYRVGVIKPCVTIVGLRSYATSTENTDEQEAGTDHKTMEKNFDTHAFNNRLTTVERDLACLVVTVTSLGSKVDDGFKRQDNWMKSLLGIFVSTILLKFVYSDGELKKDIKADLKVEAIALKKDIKADMKVEAIANKSEILSELGRAVGELKKDIKADRKVEAIANKLEILSELGRAVGELKKDIKADLKVEAIANKSEILSELAKMELRLSGNIDRSRNVKNIDEAG